MTNAEKFQKVFGYYATEMWAKPEKEFLEWINAEALEKEPSCRNTRQVDLISRQDAIDALDDIRYTDRQDWWAVLSTVENLPSVQPNPFCALADRECPFQGKEFAWCLTCPHISEEDRALVKKVASEPKGSDEK